MTPASPDLSTLTLASLAVSNACNTSSDSANASWVMSTSSVGATDDPAGVGAGVDKGVLSVGPGVDKGVLSVGAGVAGVLGGEAGEETGVGVAPGPAHATSSTVTVTSVSRRIRRPSGCG